MKAKLRKFLSNLTNFCQKMSILEQSAFLIEIELQYPMLNRIKEHNYFIDSVMTRAMERHKNETEMMIRS